MALADKLTQLAAPVDNSSHLESDVEQQKEASLQDQPAKLGKAGQGRREEGGDGGMSQEKSHTKSKRATKQNTYVVKDGSALNAPLATKSGLDLVSAQYEYFDLTEAINTSLNLDGVRLVLSRRLMYDFVRQESSRRSFEQARIISSSTLSLWIDFKYEGPGDFELAIEDHANGKPISRNITVRISKEGSNCVMRNREEYRPSSPVTRHHSNPKACPT